MTDAGSDTREWLAADGLGGYAMGTANGIRTRRYHSLLLVASPITERRFVLVNGAETLVEVQGRRTALSSQRYAPNVVHPDGAVRLSSFAAEPWPTWVFDVAEGIQVEQELVVPRGHAATLISWRVVTELDVKVRLDVRLLMSGRDWHSLHHENPAFRFTPERRGPPWQWTPYDGVPSVVVHSDAEYRHEPAWYRQFLYTAERDRGLDCIEDLASPGTFTWELDAGHRAELLLSVPEEWDGYPVPAGAGLRATCRALRAFERARVAAYTSRLHHSAEAYVDRRGARATIIAGYPWFTDWARDTMISVRGLCVETGRLADAEQILLAWCGLLSEGMFPNFHPSHGSPEFNCVDAPLWFVVVVHEFLAEAVRRGHALGPSTTSRLTDACQEILESYARGTRFGIHMDRDGLIAAGVPGVQLTWMDAVVDGRPATPRIGKPVEIQALWINALLVGSRWSDRWSEIAGLARRSFDERFWNREAQCLFDVVDADHTPAAVDARVRPNQIFACGGLPVAIVGGERARAVVDLVERELWTPMGLRTLARGDPSYAATYRGPAVDRDRAYHQGTAWPWLIGAFMDAVVRTRSVGTRDRSGTHRRLLGRLARHMDEAGVGHVSEIADGDDPFTPRGCPFQAWSLAEVGRVLRARG